MNNLNANASASNPDTTIVQLEREIAAFEHEQTQLLSRIRELRDAEAADPTLSHAAEIFTLQQEKLRLDTEILFRRNKIRLLHSQWA
ncbi:hypothetical protein TDMWS_04260 [Thermodesulfomicrobium sp. WS]|uniref:hypothetical protein n=1 Tax=Thermodesulfomicrobium sp. WS TaxID=3004129 RepID=UPI002493422D|nr:hypothetical protein [Thermodesulfomicrobium sp. WS]BDV00341.1 hypothetical protein TDMWS_04260 [Thermodesulfomicrobium sp. WS]